MLLSNEYELAETKSQSSGPSALQSSCKLTHSLRGHSKPISSVCFSPDGTKLSTSSADGVIMIWKVTLNDRAGSLPQVEFLTKLADQDSDGGEGTNDLTWSPDSEYLVSASDDHSIYVWSIPHSTTSPIRRLLGHSHCVYCVKLNPIGTLLVSGSFDETVKVWDFLGGKLLRTLPGHSEVVSCLDFSRDGSIIVSGSFDGLISFIAFTPNSHYLITSSLDSTVRIWDYRTKEGTVLKSYTGHSNTKYSIPARVVSLNTPKQKGSTPTPAKVGGEFVLMGSEEGWLWIWSLQSREVVAKIPCHTDSIIGLSVHPLDPTLLVTAGLDKDAVIKVYSLASLVP